MVPDKGIKNLKNYLIRIFILILDAMNGGMSSNYV